MTINYLDKVKHLYPEIQNVMYWSTQYDGSPWKDPYDGLVWENSDIAKPSKEELDAIDDKTVISSMQSSKEYKMSEEIEMARKYPSVQSQLDMLWGAMDRSEIPMAKEFYVALKDVKDKYAAASDIADAVVAAEA